MASIQQKTMQALVKAEKKIGLCLQEVPVPEYGPNDVMIKIHKTAICGTDMHIYNWDEWAQATIPVPMVVGHEYVGKVLALGSEVKGLEIGDRVSGEGHLTCGALSQLSCRQTPLMYEYHWCRCKSLWLLRRVLSYSRW